MQQLRLLTSPRVSGQVTLLLVILTCFIPTIKSESLKQKQTWPNRVYPGHVQFPTGRTWAYFAGQLDGYIITPQNCTLYETSIQVYNFRTIRRPAVIVKAKSLQDIQRTILFARKYNLHLTIRSSGHDFIGRNNHDGSLNLDLSELNAVKINLNSTRNRAGEATIQSGAKWKEVYKQIDTAFGPDETGKNVGRVIVGGYSLNIAMGGYVQGGGHSPIGRKEGLAADNLLEATIITANAEVHTICATRTVTRHLDGSVSSSNDTSLFWALRGGGGGTWGVVYDFTFKLHYAPERMRRIIAVVHTVDEYGNTTNKDSVKFALQHLNKLSPDWGGYIFFSHGQVPNLVDRASMVMILNHIGSSSSTSNNETNDLLNHPSVRTIADILYPTYGTFAEAALDLPFTDSYIFGSFTQPRTVTNEIKAKQYVDLIYEMVEKKLFVTLTLIGGNMGLVATGNTPISPGLRRGLFSVEVYQGFPLNGDTFDPDRLENTLAYAQKLYNFGIGSYINEPAEDMRDWKTKFWYRLEVYFRLLTIKKKWDPTNYFWCHNNVGSDLGDNYGKPNLASYPGEPVYSYFNSSV